MYFELSRLFPAFKPHEIAQLPAHYYLKLRAYLLELRKAEVGDPYAEAGYEVVDFDKEYGKKHA